MAFYRWNTLQDLVSLQERMNRILEEALRRGNLGGEEREPGRWVPSCDVFETPEAFCLHVELPGVSQSEVDLSIVGDRLVIRGTRSAPDEASCEAFLRMERMYGPFRREFTLPAGYLVDETSAEFREGVLEVRIPRRPAQVRSVPVQRGGHGG